MSATVTVPPAAVPRSAVGQFVADTLVFARRNVEHIRQIPEKLLDVTLQPLMFVLLFAFVFGGAIAVDGGSYREFLIGGILVQTLTFFMMGPGMSVAEDLSGGAIDRFRSLPSSRFAYLTGHYLSELGGAVLSIAILLGAGAIIGWRTHASFGHVVEGLTLLLVFASAMIWIGMTVGMLVRSTDAVQGIAFVVVFPLTFLSSAFVPISTMPAALEWFAAWNPVTTLTSAVRELFGNPTAPSSADIWPAHHPVTASWMYVAVLLVLGVVAGTRRFQARTTE